MPTMCDSHECDNQPDAIKIYKTSDNKWHLSTGTADLCGYDEAVGINVEVDVPVDICPYCGKNLSSIESENVYKNLEQAAHYLCSYCECEIDDCGSCQVSRLLDDAYTEFNNEDEDE